MTSQINPNNIDGNYPIAGVPNNTQGMRDNFTNTKTNFQYAADEITELQQKAVLKAAITGAALDNNMNDNLLYAVQLNDLSFTLLNVAATTGTVTLDYSAGVYQQVNTTGSVSLAFSNWSASGTTGSFYLLFNVSNTSHTLTLPDTVTQGLAGIEGISPGTAGVTNTITFANPGVFIFQFLTTDGGENIYIFDLSRPRTLFTGPVVIEDDTASISTATGALTVDGGVGVAGNLYVGGNIVGTVAVSGIAISGNISAGNASITGAVSAGGNVTGGNVLTSGLVSATGTITGGAFVGGTLDLSGNITSAANVTGNVNGGNLRTAGLVSAAANVTGGNLRTGGQISSAGNITSAGTVWTGAVSATGNIISTGSTGIGYGTGAGGTVIQSTSKSDAVTLNRICGQITMNNATLNAGAEVSFTLNNTTIAGTDCIIVNVASGATAATYTVTVDAVGTGSCRITVGNHSGSNRSEAIVLNFVVLKAVAA